MIRDYTNPKKRYLVCPDLRKECIKHECVAFNKTDENCTKYHKKTYTIEFKIAK